VSGRAPMRMRMRVGTRGRVRAVRPACQGRDVAETGRTRTRPGGAVGPPDGGTPTGGTGPDGTGSPVGAVTVAVGPEELLSERVVEEVVRRAREQDPGVEVDRVEVAELSEARLAGLLSPSLFSAARVVVVEGADQVRAEVTEALVLAAADLPADCSLVVRHPGGVRGRGLVDRLRKAGARVVTCDRLRPGDLPAFVAEEVSRAGGTVTRDAAVFLVEAVGADLRGLAAAASQLVSDAPVPEQADARSRGRDSPPTVDRDLVATYYGGHAQVSGFSIADAVLEGRTAEAVDRLRWALRAGVAPVLLVSALATGVRSLLRWSGLPRGSGESDAARALGVPPWKVRTIRTQAAAWPAHALARAQVAVAEADAAVKGGGGDAGFAVERVLLRLGDLREAPIGRTGGRRR